MNPPAGLFSFADKSVTAQQFFAAHKQDYEDALDAALAHFGVIPMNNSGTIDFPMSHERIALFSMVFNTSNWDHGPNEGWPATITSDKVYGGALMDALKTDNRARAWYEIRYRTDDQYTRRYVESQIFGLYTDADNVSEIDARKVFEALTSYQPKAGFDARLYAFNYEKAHGSFIDSTALNRDARFTNVLPYLQGGEVQTLQEILAPAAKVLLDAYTKGVSVNPLDIYVGAETNNTIKARNRDGFVLDIMGEACEKPSLLIGGAGSDTLTGGAKDDYLYGESDVDTLVASKGFDYLDGGEGADQYNFDPDFDNAIISGDTDGGQLSILGGVVFRRIGDGGASQDGLYVAMDAAGKPVAGKEGWSVSVSTAVDGDVARTTATVSIKTDNGKCHTIIIHDFSLSDSGNNFAIDLQKAITSLDLAITGKSLSVRSEMGDWKKDWNYNFLGLLINKPGYAPDFVYEGTASSDGLNGADWLDPASRDIQRAVEWSDANDEYYGDSADAERNWFKDVLHGLDGDDLITGDGSRTNFSAGNADILVGGRGKDVIYGGGGNDMLFAWEDFGNDNMHPATVGLDKGTYSTRAEALYRGKIASIENEGDSNYLHGGDGDDFLAGGSFDDVLLGGMGHDIILAGAGRDIIASGEDAVDSVNTVYGDSFARWTGITGYTPDFIAPEKMPVMAAGQEDYSRAYFYKDNGGATELRYNNASYQSANADPYNIEKRRVFNSQFDDVIVGGSGTDLIYGEIGDDTISGGSGDDQLFGDRAWNSSYFSSTFLPGTGIFQGLDKQFHGNDVIDGGAGADAIIGGAGDDRINGGEGDDYIYGDIGMLRFDKPGNLSADPETAIKATDAGWWGNDFIEAGAGDDLVTGEGGDDILDGGDGNDDLYGDWNNAQGTDIRLLNAQFGKDTLYGGLGIDQLVGGGGDDMLSGGAGDDMLVGDNGVTGSGNDGKDYLDGGSGNDKLYGDGAADTLIGGTGNDLLFGGEGNDSYLINANQGQDTISDTDGSNTLVLSETWLKKGNVISENDATRIRLYTSADKQNYVDVDNNTWLGTLKNNLRDAQGNRLKAVSDVATKSGQTCRPVLLSGVDYELDTSGKNNVTFQVASATGNVDFLKDFIATTLYEDGSAYLELYDSSRRYLTAHVTDWVALSHISDINNNPASLFMDYSANTVDGFVISGREGGDSIRGGVAAEIIYGNAGFDHLYGGAGDDVLYGGADTLDTKFSGGNYLYGGDGNDTLYGGDQHDLMDGEAGADRMEGGKGNDIYYVDNPGDVVFENAGEGADLLYTTISYSLPDYVEDLHLSGMASINGFGNNDVNYITGNEGSNILSGLGGNDQISGGLGNDILSGGV
ncbi:MAG TPA: hypothetical protein PLF22_07190, partial [Pseudomonadales bacterium]|nr:hypothetical protein [Pseudomonadales bacterium]